MVSGFAVEPRTNESTERRHHGGGTEPAPGRERETDRPAQRAAGAPADSRIRRSVESALGTKLPPTRVHTDRAARRSAAGLGARAYATGGDIVLGPDERADDRNLIAHELVHVAQQAAGPAPDGPPVQRKTDAAQRGAAEDQADAIADQVGAAMIVERDPVGGQETRAAFMAELERRVTAAANQELGPLWSAAGCPYIKSFFSRHRTSSADRLDRLAKRYSGVAKPASANDYFEPIVAKVQAGVRKWRSGGDVAAHLRPLGLDDQAAEASESGRRSVKLKRATSGEVQRKALDGAPATVPGASRGDGGSRLQAGVLHRMNRVFGRDFSGVRVHDGPEASTAARRMHARAFTLGDDVVFGSGQYRPGTLHGDGLIAHELAHVAQNRHRAAAVPYAERAVTPGRPSSLYEQDADTATELALARLYGPPTTVGPDALIPTRAADGGLRLQRCVDTPAGLPAADRNGAWQGKTVAYHVVRNRSRFPLPAQKTLGFVDSEEAAAALATAGGGGVITIEGGKYVAYKSLLPNFFTPDDHLEVEPGVLAVVSPVGHVLRGGDKNVVAPDTIRHDQDPLAGFRTAFDSRGGRLEGVDDRTLLVAFNAALRANALNVLAKSEHEVMAKKKHLAGGTTTVSDDEIGHIKATLGRLHAIAKGIENAESERTMLRLSDVSAVLIGERSGNWQRETDTLLANEKRRNELTAEIETLRRQQAIEQAKYPILGRFQSSDDLAGLMKLDSSVLLARLGGEMPGILSSIDATRRNIQREKLNLWKIQPLVEATIMGLGITDKAQQKVILDHQKALAKSETISDIVLGVFSIGLAIGAAFATGGLALGLGLGAAGLGFYDAVRMTEKYMVEADASNTEQNPALSLLSPDQAMHWGWLAVAWAGVGLDVFDVAKAAKVAGTATRDVAAGKKIATAAEEIAEQAGKKGDIGFITKLRNAAGDYPAGTVISYANKTNLERRIGTTIEIADDLPPDAVRVFYEIDELGNVTVTGCKAGTKALVSDVAAHAGVVRLLRRYDGVLGRLRQVWDRVRALVGGEAGFHKLKKGSEAWESYMELSKYEKLVKARQGRLSKAGLTRVDEQALKADIEFFENEVAHHRQVLAQMSEEAGQGFIASSGQSTRNALANGYRLPNPANLGGPGFEAADIAADPKILIDNPWYYRLKDGKYILVKKTDRPGPSLRGLPDGTFEAGTLSRAEKARRIVEGWPEQASRDAFETLGTELGKQGHKLVPIAGMSKEIGSLRTILAGATKLADFETEFLRILGEAFTRSGVKAADAAKLARQTLDGVLDRTLTVIKGTDQLRAFGYRSHYLKHSGAALDDTVDLHHIIPLYLGGDHRLANLAKLPNKPAAAGLEDLHTQMHNLIEKVKLSDSVTLAPHSAQAADLAFKPAVAVLKADGSIEFLTLAQLQARVAPPGATKAAAKTAGGAAK